MKILVENSTKENEIVLDPFVGIGATPIACQKSNRRFIGAEIDEIDITTLDSPNGAKEFMSGDIDAGECDIAGYIKKTDDEQTVVKMMALIQSGSTEDWIVTFPSGAKWEFKAFIKSFKTTEETTDGLIGFSGGLRISGLPVYTPSTSNGTGTGE